MVLRRDIPAELLSALFLGWDLTLMSLSKPRIPGSILSSEVPESLQIILHFIYGGSLMGSIVTKTYRTWSRKVLDKLQILDEINIEKIHCGNKDCLQRKMNAEALWTIPRVTVLGKMHVKWNKTFNFFRRKTYLPFLAGCWLKHEAGAKACQVPDTRSSRGIKYFMCLISI